MKITILFFTLFLLTISASYAQDASNQHHKNGIGLTFSTFGNNDFGQIFPGKDIDYGGSSYDDNGFFAIGLSYLHPVYKHLSMETGIEYENQTITSTSNLAPNVPQVVRQHQLSLISVPVLARLTFLKYFFLQGGPFLDMDLSGSNSLDSQTGLGINLGLGLNYDFKCGWSVFVNPYLKFHSIVPFNTNNYVDHLHEAAFRFGVAYQL